jgi:hypothetical protein
MPVIPVDRVVDKEIIIGKNGGPRRRRGSKIPRYLGFFNWGARQKLGG